MLNFTYCSMAHRDTKLNFAYRCSIAQRDEKFFNTFAMAQRDEKLNFIYRCSMAQRDEK